LPFSTPPQLQHPLLTVRGALLEKVPDSDSGSAFMAANRELISRFEHNIQTTLARIWGVEKNED